MMRSFELLTGNPADEEEWAAVLAAVLYLQHSLKPASPAAVAEKTLSPWQLTGRLEAVSPYRHPGSAGLWTEG
ncbi:MAG: hypothetical protein IGS03_18500 [Candidatus Sericytochromatia bacterium]|nr:hypothetical protein [Candidatus Sericytochromatia bacterium]